MFKHLFMNKMKILLKNKAMLFWSLIFPFVLGTFFQLALGNVGEAFEMEVIPVAIVDNQYYQEDKILKEVISSLSKENENQLFNTVYVDESEAQKLLDNEEIDGYILLKEDNNPQMIVKTNGINQSVFQKIPNEFNITKTTGEINNKNLSNIKTYNEDIVVSCCNITLLIRRCQQSLVRK